jgi:DNA (cytosine-5)-methyltransferase 1
MQNGTVYRLKKLAHLTDVTECSLFVGTPTATMRVRSKKFRNGRTPNPAELAQDEINASKNSWPTPTTSNAKGASKKRYLGSPHYKGDLDEAVRKSESSGQLNPTWVEWLMGFPIGWTDLNA